MKYPIGIQDFEKIRKEGFAFYDLESEFHLKMLA